MTEPLRIDVPTIGQAQRTIYQKQLEDRADYWKQQYDELLATFHGTIDALKADTRPVRLVCGQQSVTVRRTEE